LSTRVVAITGSERTTGFSLFLRYPVKSFMTL